MKTGFVAVLLAVFAAASAAPYAAAQGASAGGQEVSVADGAVDDTSATAKEDVQASFDAPSASATLPLVTVVVNFSPVVTVQVGEVAGGWLTRSVTFQGFAIGTFIAVCTLIVMALGLWGKNKISSIEKYLFNKIYEEVYEKIYEKVEAKIKELVEKPVAGTGNRENSLNSTAIKKQKSAPKEGE